MADEQKQQVQERTGAAGINESDLVAILPPKTGAFLAEGTTIKMLPSAKDFPSGNKELSKESAARALKITRSKEDINAGYAYLKRLQVMRDMLQGSANAETLKKRVRDTRELVGRVFQQNLEHMFETQRTLEKTYRELDVFFLEAAMRPGETIPYVGIVNASADTHFSDLLNPDTGLPSALPNRDNFDMKTLTGIIVVPEWVGSEAKLMKYAELARSCMAHLFAGFPNVSLAEAQEMFDVGGRFAELKSTDPVKQSISIVANHLRIRRSNRYEAKGADLYISPAAILAGKVYKGDVTEGIHVAQANKPHAVNIPTPDGSPADLLWDIRGGQQMKFNKALIPLAFYEGIVFWGVDTLYLAGGHGDEGMDQYTVKRCDEYISKVVLHYLNGRTFIPNESASRDEIYSALSTFLMHNTGTAGKMLEFGKVDSVSIVKNPDGSVNNQAIDIRISVKYKNAVRQLNLYLVSEDSEHWAEGK